MTIIGSNFAVGATVGFGLQNTTAVTVLTPDVLVVTAPWFTGRVEITVWNPGGSGSPPNGAASISAAVAVPQIGSPITKDLPHAMSASPVWTSSSVGFNATLGIVAANASADELVFYRTESVGGTYSVSNIGQYSTYLGSTIFTTVGATRAILAGGTGGLVAAATQGSEIFALYTSRVLNRTEVESQVSDNYGLSWGAPAVDSSSEGSISSPFVAVAPTGYYYATWVDSGAGPWEVDTQEFAVGGRPLGNDTSIPESAGPVGVGAVEPSVALDGLDRPLYVWTADNASNDSEVYATGGFGSPREVASLLYAGLNQTTINDVNHTTTLTEFSNYMTKLDKNVTYVMANATAFNLCHAQNLSISKIYPYVGWDLGISYANSTSACGKLATVKHPRIAEITGALTENMSLSVETEWLLESLGWGVFPTPVWPDAIAANSTAALTAFSSGNTYSNGAASLYVHATGVDPSTVLLNLTWHFPSWTNDSPTIIRTGGNGVYPCSNSPATGTHIDYSFINVTSVLNATTKVWTGSNSPQTYRSNASLLGVYLTNLSDPSVGTWHVTTTPEYEMYYTELKGCGSDAGNLIGSHKTYWQGFAASTSGQYSTYFGFAPSTPPVVLSPDGSATGEENASVNWTSSLFGSANSTLFKTTGTRVHLYPNAPGTTGYALNESFNFSGLSESQHYIMYDNDTSYVPGTNGTWGLTYNLGTTPSGGAALAAASCSFTTYADPVTIGGSAATGITNITATSAMFTWTSSKTGIGSVQYREAYGSWQFAPAVGFYNSSDSKPTYHATLKGLTPWGVYTAIVSVVAPSNDSSCQYFEKNATWGFDTAAKYSLTEEDLPFDSISRSGGGAVVTWQIPQAFAMHATYASGFASFFPLSVPANVTTVNLSGLSTDGCSYCYGINLSGMPIDENISLQVETNFTYAGSTVHGSSFPFTFWYGRDSSGDGLTDWEKERGWEVTTTNDGGAVTNRWVTADPEVWATNGLVGDTIEKRYGLNPQTLDSAGSHMLDTWNMTFSLGSSACPSLFECWYENGSNPFSFSPSPGYLPPTGDEPKATNSTDTTHTATGGLQDDSVYDAEVLWTGGALGVLQSLIAQEHVGWLRAVVMKYDGSWTLTVWGKLSWGANPLAASTLADGILDGNQPSPLLRTVLQLNITSWSATLHSSSDAGAVFVDVTNTSTNSSSSHQTYYAGYGPSQKGSSVSSSTQYHLSIPVIGNSQFVYFNVSIGDNASANGRTWYQPFAGHPNSWAVDLLGQSGYSSHTFSQSNASVSVTWDVRRVGVATTTYFVLPSNNTTLSPAPWGLKRYAAEPDFDLIVLNLSAAASVLSISGAEGKWHYDVNLSAGLNNLLIPRSIFMASPLGQAMLNNTNRTPSVPSGSGLTFHATDWSGRTETSSTNKVPTNTNPNPNYIWIYSTTAQSQNGSGSGNFGGLPANSAVESGDESLQVQAVYWVNVSSGGYGGLGTAAAEVADLLGGVAANSSGNITNNVLNVTSELGTLGLPETVLSALANTSLANNGSYNPPQYTHTSGSANGWTTFGSTVWKTVSGIAAETGISKFASAVWNGLLAATVYLERAAEWLSAHLGLDTLINQSFATLRVLASAMTWALEQLLAFIRTAVTDLLSPVTSQVNAGVSAWESGVDAAFTLADGDDGHVTAAHADAFWSAFSTGPVLVLLGITIVAVAAVTVVSTVGLGVGIIFGILLTLLLSISRSMPSALGFTALSDITSFGSALVTKIDGLLTGWVVGSGMSTAWTTVEGIFGAVSGFSWLPVFLTGAVLHGPQDGPTPAMIEIVISFVLSVIAFVLYTEANLLYQEGPPVQGYVNDTFVIAAVFGVLGCFMGVIAAANGDESPSERGVGILGAAVGAASVFYEGQNP
jgi:hypothetical protein